MPAAYNHIIACTSEWAVQENIHFKAGFLSTIKGWDLLCKVIVLCRNY